MENALKHAVAPSTKAVHLEITAALAGEKVRITVTDDARVLPEAKPASSNGVGLRNIRERLELLYGGSATLTCRHSGRDGFEAELMIPVTGHADA